MISDKFLNVSFYNAGSLGTHHDDFITLFNGNTIDILAINETWLRPGEEGRAPVVPGYRLRHIPRSSNVRSGRGGGVGFYLKRTINACTWCYPVDPRFALVEQMWLTIKLNTKKIAIGTAYRPPWQDLDLFLDAVCDAISSLGHCEHIILLGDFNVNMLNTGELAYRVHKVQDFLKCINLIQLVDTATHYTDSTSTLIDLVCTDLRARSLKVESFRSINSHSVIHCEFNIKHDKHKPFFVNSRQLSYVNRENFYNNVINLHWKDFHLIETVDEMVDVFNRNILSVFDAYAPVKKIHIKKQSYPWITDTIKIMIKLRDKALEDYRKSKQEAKKQYYKDLKSQINVSLYFEKKAYFQFNINNKIKDPKLLWKNMKSTLLPPKQDLDLPPHFNNPFQINDHFLSVPGNSVASISLLTYYEFYKHSDAHFTVVPVSQDTIAHIISRLKSNAVGYDGISLMMLEMTLPYTLPFITSIVNRSICSANFPEIWKVATVRPIPKKSCLVDVKDLRPISILPCLSKIVEKVICKQLTEYLEKNNILPTLQSGFRKSRSTSTALLDVTDNIISDQDKGMCTVLVLLDFSRAFDAINITLLLSKLSFYGFDHKTLLWFHSYLSNRHQFVELRTDNGECVKSSLSAVTRGVPQGSILGPILFILYTADIINSIKSCKYHIYADDVQLYISFKPDDYVQAIKELNEDLGRISKWSSDNCLMLNPTKTKYVLFGTKSQLSKLPSSLCVMLMGEPIDRVNDARNLGVQMDSLLRYEKHVAESVRNCFYRLKILYKIRPHLSEELRLQLVESLVLSKLNYADTVYGPRLLRKTDRLIQRVQNACVRFCFDVTSRSHVSPFLNKHRILKMKLRRKLHMACLLFGTLKFKEPIYLLNKVNWLSSREKGIGRQCSQQLLIPAHKSATFKGSFRYAASKIWNNIPPPLRKVDISMTTFRNNLRKYLLDEQQKAECITLNISVL